MRIALLILAILATVSLAANRKLIRERITVPSFRASKSENGTLTFPSSTALPPVLRGLTLLLCADAHNLLIANSPYLAVSGTAIFSKSSKATTLTLEFGVPRIRVRLSVEQTSSSDALKLSGKAVHMFRRPFAMRLHQSRRSVPAAVAALEQALGSNPDGPRLVTVVDHAAAAASVGLSLPDSSVVVFGNPAIGSQLWTRRPAVGIELPLEILVASSPLGIVYVGWNAASLLRQRFRLRSAAVEGVLTTIDTALANLAGVAADRKFRAARKRFDVRRIVTRNDIKVEKSKGDAVEAFSRLIAALVAAGPVGIAYQIPHEVSAMNAGLSTDGKINRVVVFGNPSLGTGIMQRSFTAALDLPVKMGVWTRREGASRFRVGYTTPEWIGLRHRVEVPEMLSAALDTFAGVALGEA